MENKMGLRSQLKCLAIMAAVMALASVSEAQLAVSQESRLARIKDIASVQGIRDNQLIGYGLVVGLRNTGDSQQTVFPVQTLLDALQRMGINLPGGAAAANTIRTQNMAAVFVTATLPAFAESGTKLDVTVASVGDARSLEGGLLLMTPLYGADGKVYAAAQGALVLGGYSVVANGNAQRVNYPTTARIPFGAMVERGVPLELEGKDQFSLLLNDADFR